ncbi:MAG: hypothetical protein NUV55_12060 [Sulfuricaulis sp.]|uniref:hypothetical protein n=1 Tax=Sulfuricaulis sp. TaxID=2003553 RepID=UPI0025CF08AD|nr:hypothetical protein [Sulfuricaulis sp.]MCR4347918.1 hypothetical protein [Sulfuricaulis sp.]
MLAVDVALEGRVGVGAKAAIASVSLLDSLVLYGFPEKSKLFAVGHLIFVVSALAWMFFWPRRIGRRQD